MGKEIDYLSIDLVELRRQRRLAAYKEKAEIDRAIEKARVFEMKNGKSPLGKMGQWLAK